MILDLEYLRRAVCTCCGKPPKDGHPLAIAPACHPHAGVLLDYEGGDKVMVRCARCQSDVGTIVVGRLAKEKVR